LLLRHEIKVRRIEQSEFDAAQARSVIMTIGPTQTDGSPPSRELSHIAVELRNLSGGVISDVLFEYGLQGRSVLLGAMVADYLQGGESWHHSGAVDPPIEVPERTGAADLIEMVVTFTDARGLRWVRKGRSRPQRIVDTGLDRTVLPRLKAPQEWWDSVRDAEGPHRPDASRPDGTSTS
jgi:hypothetical protein